MVIHDVPLDAVHEHADGSVTLTVPCAPAEPTDAEMGAIVAVHVTPA
jgi:hypothetical protein